MYKEGNQRFHQKRHCHKATVVILRLQRMAMSLSNTYFVVLVTRLCPLFFSYPLPDLLTIVLVTIHSGEQDIDMKHLPSNPV